MKLAPEADRIAAEVATKGQSRIYWGALRDQCDLDTGGELDCQPLDVLTDMVARRLSKHGVSVYCGYPERTVN